MWRCFLAARHPQSHPTSIRGRTTISQLMPFEMERNKVCIALARQLKGRPADKSWQCQYGSIYIYIYIYMANVFSTSGPVLKPSLEGVRLPPNGTAKLTKRGTKSLQEIYAHKQLQQVSLGYVLGPMGLGGNAYTSQELPGR